MIYFLHDAMKMVLRKKAKPMTPTEISDIISTTKIFVNVDGTSVSETDVLMRALLHPEIFKVDYENKNMISFNPSYKEAKPESDSESGNKFKL